MRTGPKKSWKTNWLESHYLSERYLETNGPMTKKPMCDDLKIGIGALIMKCREVALKKRVVYGKKGGVRKPVRSCA